MVNPWQVAFPGPISAGKCATSTRPTTWLFTAKTRWIRLGAMIKTVQIGSPPIEVHLRRSTRARRYSLKVSNADGTVSLTLPNRASERAALSFAKRQEEWLRAALGKLPPLTAPVYGGTIPFEGRDVVLQPGAGRLVRLEGQSLLVPGTPTALPAKLRGFLKVQARAKLVDASQIYADLLGRKLARVTLRDTRSRWGSCTEAGNLMFSWRLIMAPPEVLKYVAAHEVAHLVEMNHSADFWQQVEGLMPDYQTPRRWLKQNGTQLHRVQF